MVRSAPSGSLYLFAFLISLGRGLLCDAADLRPFPAGTTVMPGAGVLSYVTQEAVRDDLKLTEDQRKRIDRLREDLQQARLAAREEDPRAVLDRMADESEKAQSALAEILTPDQVRRHLQIALQQSLVSGHGLTGLLELAELKEVLQLNRDQQDQIESIRDEAAGAATEAFRAQVPRGIGMFANMDVSGGFLNQSELGAETDSRISAVLTTEQKHKFLEALGPPLVGRVMPAIFSLPRPPMPPLVVGAPIIRLRPLPLPIIRTPVPMRPVASLGGESLAESSLNAALLSFESVREELKVSPEQVQQEILLGADATELARCIRQFDQWLKPAQLDRLRQLALQVSLNRNGPAAVFAFREVIEALQLRDEQRDVLAEQIKGELNSNRHLLLLAVESDSDGRHAIEKDLGDRLHSVLTASQQERLSQLLGEPFRGRVSLAAIDRVLQPRLSMRARTTTALGQMTLNNPFCLTYEAIQDELELSDKQREAIGTATDLIRNRDKALEVLSAAQKERYSQIILQGEVRRDGPAAVFRYRSVIDELAPNEEQQRRLLEILREDLCGYLRIPFDRLEEKLPELDATIAGKLESALTDSQREKLAGLLGEPSPSIDQPARPAGRLRKANN